MVTMIDLPLELKNEVFRRFSIKEYPKIALTCRPLSEVIKNEYLWQQIYNRKGVKKYRESYLGSTRVYVKRWRWIDNEHYCVSEDGLVIKRDPESQLFYPCIKARKPMRNNERLKIKIECIDYLYIRLESKIEPIKFCYLRYEQLDSSLSVYAGLKCVGNSKERQNKLKVGDIITIELKNDEAVFRINGDQLLFDMTEETIKYLKPCSGLLYPTLVLNKYSIVRIINE